MLSLRESASPAMSTVKTHLLSTFGIMTEEVTLHDTLPWTILLSQRNSYTVHTKHPKGNRAAWPRLDNLA